MWYRGRITRGLGRQLRGLEPTTPAPPAASRCTRLPTEPPSQLQTVSGKTGGTFDADRFRSFPPGRFLPGALAVKLLSGAWSAIGSDAVRRICEPSGQARQIRVHRWQAAQKQAPRSCRSRRNVERRGFYARGVGDGGYIYTPPCPPLWKTPKQSAGPKPHKARII